MVFALCKLFGRMPFYAVAHGRNVGVFNTWTECEAQVKGFAGAIFKKFKTTDEAKDFIAQKRPASKSTSQPTPNPPPAAAVSAPKPTLSVRTDLFPPSTTTASSTSTANKRPANGNSLANFMHAAKKTKIDEKQTSEYTSNIKQMQKYGDNYFFEDTDGFVHVYTDGSCENNGRANAIAGYGVYFGEGHKLNTAAPVNGPATNNRGEIQAVTRAIELAVSAGITKLCINADSHFVIRSVTEWMKNWKKKNWRLSSGGAVKNEVDFRQLDRIIERNPQLEIRWQYVPAHTGIRGNERADELARQGAQLYRI